MIKKTFVSVCQKVQFDPYDDIKGFGLNEFHKTITGTIIAVYPKHRWFLVEYGIHKLRTSFKFCDIGDGVEVIG